MNRQLTLTGLGYWRSVLEPQYPDVACFVDATWSPSKRLTTLHYLHQGYPLHYWMGVESCLLGCGDELFTTGYTDGTYYWPETLLHYVADHAVRLPDAFTAHIQRQTAFPASTAKVVPERIQADFTWWQLQRGWQPNASSLHHLSQQKVRELLRRYEQQRIHYSQTTTDHQHARQQMVQELRSLLRP